MSTFSTDPVAAAAFWIVVKASLVLASAAVACGLLRRASAEARHLVLTGATMALLLLPVLWAALPGWPLVIRTVDAPPRDVQPFLTADAQDAHAAISPLSHPADTGGQQGASQAVPTPSLKSVFLALYASGAVAMLALFTMHWRTARRLVREAVSVDDADWTGLLAECSAAIEIRRAVRLLRSRESSMPMAWGTWRPAVLIPAIADTWPVSRRRAVILHELAHVARRDCLTQALAYAVRAIFWFHPGAWWLARRLRVERELACDDRVIAAGTHGQEYAGHLLEIAYALGRQPASALAVSMAAPRHLESRMLAALDAARNRRVPRLETRVAGVVMGVAALLSIAAARPTILEETVTTAEAPTASHAGASTVTFSRTIREPAGRIAPASRPTPALQSGGSTDASARDDSPGTWEIRPGNTEGTVHLRLVEEHSSSGSNVPIGQLEGLTAAQLAGGGPVQFRVRRDAGTFTFDGAVRSGVGAGTFTFAADPAFGNALAARGFARPNGSEQYQLARHDIGFAFVDELGKQGYAKPPIAGLVRAGQHGVHLTYLRDMGALGYRLGSLDSLIELRDHGVTPDYVRELADEGYKGLPAAELRNARDHGVTPEYIRGMRQEGYASTPLGELVSARDHGVTPEFARELGAAGLRKVPLADLIRLRDHGVSAEFVRQLAELGHRLPIDDLVRARDHGVTAQYVGGMRELGYQSATIEQLIAARDHGVSVEFVRAMSGYGYVKQPMDALIRLRDHGVNPKYVEELKALGYDRLTVDELVTLRDHGLTPEKIRTANARAGSQLPVETLRSLAAGGSL
jgi:beta-lactamase regulating signal transducer with metallopeptidase domain